LDGPLEIDIAKWLFKHDRFKFQRQYRNMVGLVYILFNKSGGEFAFGCVPGAIQETADGNAVSFTWSGNDEMDEAFGEGCAEIPENGTVEEQICFHGGDEADFSARR
jgi:hypothetical protein